MTSGIWPGHSLEMRTVKFDVSFDDGQEKPTHDCIYLEIFIFFVFLIPHILMTHMFIYNLMCVVPFLFNPLTKKPYICLVLSALPLHECLVFYMYGEGEIYSLRIHDGRKD